MLLSCRIFCLLCFDCVISCFNLPVFMSKRFLVFEKNFGILSSEKWFGLFTCYFCFGVNLKTS